VLNRLGNSSKKKKKKRAHGSGISIRWGERGREGERGEEDVSIHI
jgi:hypothetical protein